MSWQVKDHGLTWRFDSCAVHQPSTKNTATDRSNQRNNRKYSAIPQHNVLCIDYCAEDGTAWIRQHDLPGLTFPDNPHYGSVYMYMYVVFPHYLNPSCTSQHTVAHGNPTATQNSSSAASTSSKRLLSLRSQCLLPGEYHRHSKWLEYFPPKQVRALIGTKPYTYMIPISCSCTQECTQSH